VITPNAPPSLRGNAPFMRLLNAARGRFPSRLSRDAGRYLCNYIFWQALQGTNSACPLVQFVHIPPVAIGRRRGKDRRRSIAELVGAAEAVLIALKAAARSR
jgi:pyroglutamyl-peptidase